ncbi:MAG: hypothetical protein M3N47_07150 [Chloroflexota bacterium]|nr:hypothetical protein [Chloroflexota bacterium]
MVVRQAHPGPKTPHYRSDEEKRADARRHKEYYAIPWPVVADDLAGTVHQVYSGMADPTFLLDADRRVAYYNMWTFAPSLDRAISALLRQGGRGVVAGGIDHLMHPWPVIVDGWRGIRLGLPRSFLELELAAPGSASLIWLGSRLRPMLAPVVLRAERLAPRRRAALVGTAAALALTLGASRLARR